MVQDYSMWPAGTRAMRWMRLGAPVGVLLACLLLAGMPALASAATPEMRGEWEIVGNGPYGQVKGTALIRNEANSKGEFASSSAVYLNTYQGSFSGTLEGSKATITLITYATASAPEVEIKSNSMTVTSSASAPSMSGSGELFVNKAPVGPATLLITRIKTYKEVEEREAQEAKEKQEREEREVREKIPGEWSLVVKAGPQTANGTALIKVTPGTDNKFSSSSALFEGVVPGSFSGTLEGSTATVTVTSESVPAEEFVGEKLTLDTNGSSLSIAGTGKLYSDKTLVTESATLVATKTKTYAEVTAREAKEKLEQETREKEAQEKLEQEVKEKEAKAKAEQEAKAKAELEAKTRTEQEAKAKAELEAKAKAEQEAKQRQEREAQEKFGKPAALISVQLTDKAFTVGPPGLLSMHVTNPNLYAISGRIVLILAQSAKGGKGSRGHGNPDKKARSLGTVSFGISPEGKQLVKLELSRGGRAELARHKTLRALATILTKANGQTSTTKTFTIALHAGKAA
jgi:hypothetical protein